MRFALVASVFLVATAADAQAHLSRADVAAADTVKIRIDIDDCTKWCPVKQAVITRDGLVRRTARMSGFEMIIALDTIQVSRALIDSMTRAIGAAGFDTLQVAGCARSRPDARHATVTVARGPARRSVRSDEDCPGPANQMQRIEAAIDHVASVSSWSLGPPLPTPHPPSYVALAGCYLLGHGEWQGPTSNRFKLPPRIQLEFEPATVLGRPSPGYFAMSPWLPRDVARRSGFAVWRPAERGFELRWGDGFSGITATLAMQIDSYDGTGTVYTDMVGRETPSTRLSVAPVRCAE